MLMVVLKILVLFITAVFCQEVNIPNNRNLFLRRRDSVPLHTFHNQVHGRRRLNRDDETSYRKTREILVNSNKYEIASSSELNSVNFDPMLREKKESRKEMRDSKSNKILKKEDKKEQLDKFRRWLTVNTDDGIGIGLK